MSRIRDRAVPYDTVRDPVEDQRNVYDEIERRIDGTTEEDERIKERLAMFNRFLEELPPRTADGIRTLLMTREIVSASELARRIGVNRSTLSRNIHRASRRVWGTSTPPFSRGGSGCA